MSSIGSSIPDTSSLAAGAATATDAYSELNSQDFVKIMFSELSNQDPLKPNDSNTLMQELSSLRSIESNVTLETKLGDVVTQNQLSTAGALIGKYVGGYTATFDPAQGLVSSISTSANGPILNLSNGSQVPFANIAEIVNPPSN